LEEAKKVVAKCPKCGKDVIEKKSKRGKIFYSCVGYPECDYSAWNIPANEKCPTCGEDMIVKLYKNMKVISCLKCKYSRREKIESKNADVQENETTLDEIDILNKLDEQNENS
jgi:DNA topoisomerase-1